MSTAEFFRTAQIAEYPDLLWFWRLGNDHQSYNFSRAEGSLIGAPFSPDQAQAYENGYTNKYELKDNIT